MNTRTLCPGWPKGPCGNEAGTAWTNQWCEQCDEKRRYSIAKSLEKNVLEPTAVDMFEEAQPFLGFTSADDYINFIRSAY